MYVDAFDYEAGDILGLTRPDKRQRYNATSGKMESEKYNRPSLRLAFEEMTSPREYNFETDRLFCEIPLAVVRQLFAMSKAEGHATLANVIRRRFTSRSGFISFYDNDLAAWLEKPVRDWDHNELGTLLFACLELKGGADWENGELDMTIYYRVAEDGGITMAWESAVDWPAFEKARDEMREEKAAELRESDPERAQELGLTEGGAMDWRNSPAAPHPAQMPLPL